MDYIYTGVVYDLFEFLILVLDILNGPIIFT